MAQGTCYVCEKDFPLLANHHCQPECQPLRGTHKDFCSDCKAALRLQFAQQEPKEEKPRPEND